MNSNAPLRSLLKKAAQKISLSGTEQSSPDDTLAPMQSIKAALPSIIETFFNDPMSQDLAWNTLSKYELNQESYDIAHLAHILLTADHNEHDRFYNNPPLHYGDNWANTLEEEIRVFTMLAHSKIKGLEDDPSADIKALAITFDEKCDQLHEARMKRQEKKQPHKNNMVALSPSEQDGPA